MGASQAGDSRFASLSPHVRSRAKKSPGRGIQDEKPIAAEPVKVDFRLPKGTRAASVSVVTPEQPEPVKLDIQTQGGRVQFTVPGFLVYSVARIELE